MLPISILLLSFIINNSTILPIFIYAPHYYFITAYYYSFSRSPPIISFYFQISRIYIYIYTYRYICSPLYMYIGIYVSII